MAIEPLGSMMSVQAQQVSAPRPVTSVEKVSVDTPNYAQASDVVDKTTQIVGSAQNDGRQNGASQQEPSNEQIRKAVEQMNKKMTHSEAVFGIHEETNRVTIKIVDKDTEEVIKEFPPEKTLDMIAKVWELAGLLVDEKR